MPTGVVSIGSDLQRKSWMREGLVQAASMSFWNAYTGNSKNAIVFQSKNENSKEGHTVVFDYDGNLSGKAIKGKDTAFGKGEQKRKFSDKCTVERYRLPVDNGDKFDGVDIGDLSINEHTHSRGLLGDLWTRWKDQGLFDAGQGILSTVTDGAIQAPSHIIDLGTTFNFNALLDIENTVKTSRGYTTGSIRRPPPAFVLSDGTPIWLFMMDSMMANILRQDTAGYQTLVSRGDVRGMNNANFRGLMGRIGQLMLVEAPLFFGSTSGSTSGWGVDESEVEIAGLRQYDGADPATALWTGQDGFDPASTNLHSRGLILGAGALQCAFGKQPDYRYQESTDFGIKSESALEVWTEFRKTTLTLESGKKYKQAKVDGIDHAVIAVDLEVQ